MPLLTTSRSPTGAKSGALQKVRTLRQRYWSEDLAVWGDTDTSGRSREKGFFTAPRTLPMIMTVLRDKDISENKDPGPVYLELLARHKYEGIVEIGVESDHAFCAGYTGTRATRTWRERMKILEKAGFIKVMPRGNQEFGTVLIVHPAEVLDRLRRGGRMTKEFWDAYSRRQEEGKERDAAELRALQRQKQPAHEDSGERALDL